MQKTNAAALRPDAPETGPDRAAPRRGRGRLRVEDARELELQLIAAAQDAFATDGYGATSMAALARQAGISKTTLYAKFPTKADLFRAVIDRQLERAYELVELTAGAGPKTLASSLSHLAEQTIRQALAPENLRLNRLIDWEAPRFPELAEMARARARIGIEHIAGYIRDFAQQDQVSCRDPVAAAELFNFTVRGLYHDIQIGAQPADPKVIHAKVERIVEAFLASRPSW